ncbi:undecaprenyl-diphosphatase [Tamaricihabitans halophyticus]|uniref:Undecaprenyl-diphosphatase n=1 Tax=Tamaricihabitans halophyticus TaxID=1262583 RepID=A0A4R2QE90_9PSEU|nr:phosphatase PAP2 family protein [Tamaricihabitans halophyticus]TCP46774.1 undecaprenyl-diphosphatase [Tamaricihabitans halophyticus]
MPEFSIEWYRTIVDFAAGTPRWLQDVVDLGTSGVLFLFAILGLIAIWLARHGSAATLARALLIPVAPTIAYLCSTVAKSAIQQERPCHAVLDRAATITTCPPMDSWSFPSNHSTIAAAAAVALALAWRKLTPVLVLLGLFAGFSRIFVGVHYPHDVAVGLALGAAVAVLVYRFGTSPATRLVGWGRHRFLGTAEPGGTAEPSQESGLPTPRMPGDQARPVTGRSGRGRAE